MTENIDTISKETETSTKYVSRLLLTGLFGLMLSLIINLYESLAGSSSRLIYNLGCGTWYVLSFLIGSWFVCLFRWTKNIRWSCVMFYLVFAIFAFVLVPNMMPKFNNYVDSYIQPIDDSYQTMRIIVYSMAGIAAYIGAYYGEKHKPKFIVNLLYKIIEKETKERT